MSFSLAIIGRPNVGKSTLFNRLTGRRLAIVHDRPGVTRDRREADARLGDLHFTVIDTAGLEAADAGSVAALAQTQSARAIDMADIVLFVVDARTGITPVDEAYAEEVRKFGKPTILAANKCEGSSGDPGRYDAYRLGLGEPVALSAEHGLGFGDLEAALEQVLEKAGLSGGDDAQQREDDEDGTLGPDRPLRVTIVGRPNTGKSTLINTLLGEDRLVTSPEAGTTRDAIAVAWRWKNVPVKLFDTAGLRRRARVNEGVEKLSVADTLRAIRFSEVAVLTVDATQPFEKQDLQIADLIEREGRAAIIALTKWDLVKDRQETLKTLRAEAERLLPQLRGIPILPLSGLTGRGLDKLMPQVFDVYERWNKRISTGLLNRWLREAIDRHPPPAPGGRRIRIRYMTQAKARPPTFVAFCSRPQYLPEAYKRYLLNGLREVFGLESVPLRLSYRKGENPYD